MLAKSTGIDITVSHISTGGGALIESLRGVDMPVFEALKVSKRMFMHGDFAIKPKE